MSSSLQPLFTPPAMFDFQSSKMSNYNNHISPPPTSSNVHSPLTRTASIQSVLTSPISSHSLCLPIVGLGLSGSFSNGTSRKSESIQSSRELNTTSGGGLMGLNVIHGLADSFGSMVGHQLNDMVKRRSIGHTRENSHGSYTGGLGGELLHVREGSNGSESILGSGCLPTQSESNSRSSTRWATEGKKKNFRPIPNESIRTFIWFILRSNFSNLFRSRAICGKFPSKH